MVIDILLCRVNRVGEAGTGVANAGWMQTPFARTGEGSSQEQSAQKKTLLGTHLSIWWSRICGCGRETSIWPRPIGGF